MRPLLAILFLLVGSLADAQQPPVFWPRGDGLIAPLWGTPGQPYYPIPDGKGFRSPKVVYSVWFDPTLKQHRDTSGVDLLTRHKEGALYFGTVSSTAFREVAYDAARWRFHYATPAAVWQLSHSGHPANTPGSMYYAVSRDGREIYTSDAIKPAMGGGTISYINAIRFPWHAWLCSACGFRPQGHFSDDQFARPPPVAGQPLNESSGAMRNPNLSGPILWTTADYLRWHTKAGFDSREIGVLQRNGSAWIWRSE